MNALSVLNRLAEFRLEASFHDPTLPLIHAVIQVMGGGLLSLYYVEERILHGDFGRKILKLAEN